MYLFMAVLGLHCCVGFSLVAVASVVAEHRLQGTRASVVVT